MLIYNLLNEDGRLVSQCLSEDGCLREAGWFGLARWRVVKDDRDDDSWGRPRRYVKPWPEAKLEEFRIRYTDGQPLKELEEFFETNISVLCAKARTMGIPRRFTWVDRWERHYGKWTEREDELVRVQYYENGLSIDEIATQHVKRTFAAVYSRIMYKAYSGDWSAPDDEVINFMYDEGVSLDEIAQHFKRFPAEIGQRLSETAGSRSTRSRGGRFVDGRRSGSRSRVLEAPIRRYASEPDRS